MVKSILFRSSLFVVTICSLFILAPSCNSTPTLSVVCSPSSGGTVNPATGTYSSGLVVSLTATPSAGYRFDHWEGGASGQAPTVQVTMNGSQKVTAYFTKTYTLSIQITPSNGGSVSPNNSVYDAGQSVTIIATPSTYYQFAGWGGDTSGNSNTTTVVMNSNKNIVASFSQITYTLQTTIGTPNGGTVQPSSGIYAGGSTLTVTAVPAQGYRFNDWQGSASSTNPILSILMDMSKTLTAFFTKVYNLTVSVSPNGIGSVNVTSGSHDSGSVVPITATTSTFPYAFDHWSGTDNNAANPTTVTMNSDESINAYFKQLSPGALQTLSGQYSQGSGITIVNLKLTSGQWVQGQLGDQMTADAQIIDASNNVVENLGSVSNTNFTFQAPSSGTYSIKISTHSILFDNYTLTYTIYS